MSMFRVAQDPSVEELGGHVGVDAPDDDRGDEHECECRFSCPWLGQGSNDWGGGILSEVVVTYSSDDTKDGELHDRQCGESFGEVGRVLHLGDEGWVEDLTDPEKGDTTS